MIYAHIYESGTRFKTESGEWKKNTILSLNTVKTHGVELVELKTPEDAMRLTESSGVQMVAFYMMGLPRHPAPVTHPKLGQYVRRLFKTRRGD